MASENRDAKQRPYLASVENTVDAKQAHAKAAQISHISTNHSINSSKPPMDQDHSRKSQESQQRSPIKSWVRPSSSSSSSNEHSATRSSSTHSNLSSGLLTPTLASALGISTSSKKKKRSSQKRHSYQVAIEPAWARRPSLPTLSSNGRMSMCSISSFDSLQEANTSLTSSPPIVASKASKPVKQSDDEANVFVNGFLQPQSPSKTTQFPQSESKSPIWTKRKNVAMELLSTERAYVTTLKIVNDHYYRPLLALSKGIPLTDGKSLSKAAPVLSKAAMAEIFSNFADILHLNAELFCRLDDRMSGRCREPPKSRPVSMVVAPSKSLAEIEDSTQQPWDAQFDLIGDLLVPMAPFLKMYSFYVKNFSSALNRIEAERRSSDQFSRFLKETEQNTWMPSAEGRSNGFGFGLGLQAHLLSVVQRIPRYKLLVGELVKCTPPQHRDYPDLCKAYKVVEQVAESINDNIRQHEVVLQMLHLQRQLVGLPFPLIVPGRSLVKRGTLVKAGRKDFQPREFFLFTDCIIYAAPIQGTMADASAAAWSALSRYGAGENTNSPLTSPTTCSPLPGKEAPPSPNKAGHQIRRRTTSFPTRVSANRLSASLEGQQLQFRDILALQDCTVVAVDDGNASEQALGHCMEIHSPGKSFAVYTSTLAQKMEWISAIRNAREEWQTNRRTLHTEEDSIQAKRDRRRSLQAVGRQNSQSKTGLAPTPVSIPEGAPMNVFPDTRVRRESLPSFPTSTSLASYLGASSTTSVAVHVLEEYNAPVWVPDSCADKCACCNEHFGIWRRKHHCRLCGQVVCWACSSRTFLIAGYEDGVDDRPARACDVCYDSVFPQSQLETSNIESTEHQEKSVVKPESDTSAAPSGPPTPTSPSEPPLKLDTKSSSTDELRPDHLFSLSIGNEDHPIQTHVFPSKDLDNTTAPATRVAKANATEPQLFHGNLLSPRIHAATSGTGTFRLVTPRLTTPEGEKAPTPKSSSTSSLENSHSQFGKDALPPGTGSDYFAGVSPGRSELPKSSAASPRRRKPLSAAARLSSVYGSFPNLHNIPPSTN